MSIEKPSPPYTQFELLLAASASSLTKAAFSASCMAAVAWHYGTEVRPFVRHVYLTTPDVRIVWEADLSVQSKYSPLDSDLCLSILKAGRVGEEIGLALRDSINGPAFIRRLKARAGDLKEQCKIFGVQRTHIPSDLQSATNDMLSIFWLLLSYREEVIANACSLSRQTWIRSTLCDLSDLSDRVKDALAAGSRLTLIQTCQNNGDRRP